MTQTLFGSTAAGEPVEIFTLTNSHGVQVQAMTWGARIVSILAPDRDGQWDDIVLGYDSLASYLDDAHYLGAVVGRVANRIANARFTLDGIQYRLSANDGVHHLHGGFRGFDKVVWQREALHNGSLSLSYISPDGEEGYPGTLNAKVRYTLNDRNELLVDYRGRSDGATPINLTQHSSFNLAGAGKGNVLDHLLQLNANHITPIDETRIPTGEIIAVGSGPFDFRSPTAVGARLEADHVQLRRGDGYDHNFVLNRGSGGPTHAGRVVDPASGRTLDIYTTEPGVHLYSGNFLHDGVIGKEGRRYQRRGGLSLETQHFPDSPNQPLFPSTILRPGSEYRSRTVFAFGVVS